VCDTTKQRNSPRPSSQIEAPTAAGGQAAPITKPTPSLKPSEIHELRDAITILSQILSRDPELLDHLVELPPDTCANILNFTEEIKGLSKGKRKIDKEEKKEKILNKRLKEQDDKSKAEKEIFAYQKWMNEITECTNMALEKNWQKVIYNKRMVSLKAIDTIDKIEKDKVGEQFEKISKNLEAKRWDLEILLSYNYYLTCMLWKKIAEWAKEHGKSLEKV